MEADTREKVWDKWFFMSKLLFFFFFFFFFCGGGGGTNHNIRTFWRLGNAQKQNLIMENWIWQQNWGVGLVDGKASELSYINFLYCVSRHWSIFSDAMLMLKWFIIFLYSVWLFISRDLRFCTYFHIRFFLSRLSEDMLYWDKEFQLWGMKKKLPCF